MTLQAIAAYGQPAFRLTFVTDSSHTAWFAKLVKNDAAVYDSLGIIQRTNGVIRLLAEASYITASAGLPVCADSSCVVKIEPGNAYRWVALRKGNAGEDVLTASGFREHQFYNKPFDYTDYNRKVDKMLSYLEENGYPFAQVKLDSIKADSLSIAARLDIDKGDLIKFDTVEVVGDANIKSWFVGKYLGIKKDNLYNEQLIRNGNSRLSQLPFLQITRPGIVYFVGSTARPVVFLSNRRSSSIDGVIGFAPASDNNNSKLLITGEANLRLQNLFGTGKSFDLAFRSFLSGSQELRTKIVWPYIFRSSIGLDYELNLLKFDSTFLDVKHDVGIQYRLIGNDYIKAFYTLQTTTLITVDTNAVRVSKALPQANDLRNDLYGLGMKMTRYDYFFNPRKGYSIEATAAAGIRNIQRNPTVDGVRFRQEDGSSLSIYDTMQLRSVQYRFYLRGDVFVPLSGRLVCRGELVGGHVKVRTCSSASYSESVDYGH